MAARKLEALGVTWNVFDSFVFTFFFFGDLVNYFVAVNSCMAWTPTYGDAHVGKGPV